ncbi:MAG: hypothetical protein IJ404_05720, partial [Clostridia bacterium]|nr:hypothetical protein [Clostridia bacterium]
MSFTDNFLKELEKKKLDNNGGKSPHSGGGKTSQPSKVSSVDDFTDSFLSELGKALEREKKRQQLRNDNDIAPFVSDGSSKKEKDDIEYEITLGRDKNGNLIKHSDLINYEELPFIDKMRIAKKKEEAAKKKQEEAKEKKTSKSEKRTWFKSGAFADGYNFGDVAKSILGTTGDLVEEVLEGIIEIPETVIDAGAYLVGGAGKLFGADDFANKTQKFIAKDLYDAEAFIKENNKNTIGTNLLSWGGTDIEEASLLGDKSEGLANSAGQLVATTALQAVGVPWFVTSGVTSFGGEVENAFQQGASYEEAGISAAITAGAEILTEKLFGGSGLGEKGLINTEVFTKAISNKGLKVLADFGIDVLSEGGEEVASQFFSTLGQQLTYEKEETWAEILSDEEKAEAYLYQVFNSLFGKEAREAYGDAFVGGMALSGGMNAGKVTSSLKNGTDYRTGLTANEEAVVSKETENRIAEAEKDGKKLTNKEKAVIRDQALKALKKGDISTDVIEEVLGGDTYKSYQDTVKNEDTLRKEYDELADIKKSELTAKQEKRLNELEAKLEELKTTSERDFLQKQYKNEAYELAKGTKLEESYRERTRKAQKYDADTSQYKGIAKESIQSIIDKGQINNTNKAHELIDFAVNSAAARGKKVTTTTTAEILAKAEQKHGKDYVRDYFFKQVTDENGNKKLTLSKIPNAEIDGDTIALNVNSPNLTQVVIGHEIGHTFEGTKYYGELAELLNSYDESVKGEEAYTARKNATDTKYQNIAGANSRYELNADLLGEYIFSDEGFVRHLVQNEKVFTGILGRIKYMLKYATSGSQQERDLLRIKRTFEKAWRDAKTANKTGGKTKSAYSLVDVEAVDKYSPKQYNDFGWARYAEAISKNELDDLYSKIQEKGSLKKFMQSGYGEAIIEVNDDPHSTLGVDNVFVFVTGTKNNPVINKVVRFDIETETEMEVIKEQLYERRTFSYTYYSFLREKGLAREYRKKSAVNYIGYRQEVRERSGRGDSNGTYGNGGFERDGRGTLGKTSSDEIAPFEKASSEDGVFFDGKSHFSLANAVDAPVGQGTPLKDLRVNALPDDFAPIAETPNSQTSVDSENGDVNRVDVSSKEYISFEDFANTDSSIWRNVEYDDTATKSAIMQEVHDAMVKDGSVIQVSENITSRVEESFPDLRGMKKKERTPILKEAINKLKSNLRQFLNGFKNQTFEFEVDGKVLEAKLYNTGINEVLEKITQDKASMLYTTEEIFGNARYLYSTPDYDGDPNVYRWNYFYTPVQIGSETVGVRIAVRDVSKGTHNHAPESQIYNWNIKKDASLDGESHDPRAASFGVSSDASIDASLGGERDDSNNRYPSSASSDVSNNIIAPESDVVKSSEETQANVNSDGENKFPSVRELYEQKLSNHKNALAALESNKSNSLSSFDEAIRK